jgi:hypothetical protein
MFTWIDIVGRIRFVGFGVAPKTIRLVAWRMALYGDPDGSRVFPGTARLAVVCGVDYKTVKRVVSILAGLYLISKVSGASGPIGQRRARGTEYQLTVPVDLMDRVDVLSPAQVEKEAEVIRQANRRVTGPRVPRKKAAPEEVTGNSSPTETELRGTSENSYGELESAVPTSDLPPTTPSPSVQDPAAALTVTRTQGREQAEISPKKEKGQPEGCGRRNCIAGRIILSRINSIQCPDCTDQNAKHAKES